MSCQFVDLDKIIKWYLNGPALVLKRVMGLDLALGLERGFHDRVVLFEMVLLRFDRAPLVPKMGRGTDLL